MLGEKYDRKTMVRQAGTARIHDAIACWMVVQGRQGHTSVRGWTGREVPSSWCEARQAGTPGHVAPPALHHCNKCSVQDRLQAAGRPMRPVCGPR